MNRIVRLTFMVLLLFNLNVAKAQTTPSISIKGGLSGAFHSKYKMALELKFWKDLSIEITGGYRRYNPLQQDAFQGIMRNEYAIQRSFQSGTNDFGNYYTNISGWSYLGSGRPWTSTQPESNTALSTSRITLGLRKSFRLNRKGCSFYVMPAISGALHQTYEIGKAVLNVTGDKYDQWRMGSESADQKLTIYTTYYTQKQEMAVIYHWYAGPSTTLGWAWHSNQAFMIEVRCNIGVNFGPTPPRETKYISELQPMYGQLDVMIGYCFGRY